MAVRAPLSYPQPAFRGIRKPLRPVLDLAHPLSKGLFGCWNADEGGGKLLKDISPLGNTATLSGLVGWTGSHHGGQATNFASASSQYAACDTLKGAPLFASALAMSIWIKPVSVAVGRQIAFTIAWDNGSSAGALDIEISPSNQLQVVKWSAQVMAASGITPPAGAWTHVGYTQDAATTNTIYINGAVAGTATAARNLGSAGIMRLASFNAAFPTPYFNGGLDGARVYNRCLSAAEIARLYQEPWAGQRDLARPAFRVGAAAAGGTVLSRYYYDQHIARAA